MFVHSTPGDVPSFGCMGFGNSGDMGRVCGSVGLFMGIVAYFGNKHKTGQIDGRTASRDKTTL